MDAEERNFRSFYYDKFGIRGVEEKKSVEILLREPTISREKLQQFCLRFTVPTMYRVRVWKILLGVLPANQESTEFVWSQRQQQYKDMTRGMNIMRRLKDDDPPEIRLLKLYCLELGQLPLLDENLLGWEKNKNFAAIAKGMTLVTDSEIDQFWVTTRFYRQILQQKEIIDHYPGLTLKCLKKEDAGQRLYKHIVEHNLLTLLPLKDWFDSCFAEVLPGLSFQRVWDKMIGGSFYIMVCVAVAILLFFQRPLLSMTSSEAMVTFLQKIPDDCGDKIVNNALELWTKNGSCLLLTKSESPVVVADKTKS